MTGHEAEIVYSPELAMRNLADRLAQSEYDNAILRASITYYQGALAEAQMKDAMQFGMSESAPPPHSQHLIGSN